MDKCPTAKKEPVSVSCPMTNYTHDVLGDNLIYPLLQRVREAFKARGKLRTSLMST